MGKISFLCLLSLVLISCDGNSNGSTNAKETNNDNATPTNEPYAASSFAGESIRFNIASGTGLFAPTGSFIINVSGNGNEYYSVAERGNAGGSYGTFLYTAEGNQGFAKILARSYTFSALGVFDAELTLTFTSKTSGTFRTSSGALDSVQTGTFSLIDTSQVQAPSSIAGKSIRLYWPPALGYAPDVLSFDNNTNSVILNESDGETTSGSYSYANSDNIGTVNAISEDNESVRFIFTFTSASEGSWRYSNFSDSDEYGGTFRVE